MTTNPMIGDAGPVVLERAAGLNGELVLRRAGEHLEIISNGVFLMDTRNGESERLLITAALDRIGGRGRVLIGGLGVGFSLAAAIAAPGVTAVDVVEREPAVIGWHAGPLRPFSAGALDDPRVRVLRADLVELLRRSGEAAPAGCAGRAGRPSGYDAICLDIDNGPDWTVVEGNARLYSAAGLTMISRSLAPGGVLAVWSATAAPEFAGRLAGHFTAVEVVRVPVPRGEPDVVFLARSGVPEVSPGTSSTTV